MPLLSQTEVLNLKLRSLPSKELRALAARLEINSVGSVIEVVERIMEGKPDEKLIDGFIKQGYSELIQKRQTDISDEELKNELMKVETFSWGVVQGQLDQKIQSQYVRKNFRYTELLESVKATLYDQVANYVTCTWFNHWTTVLIEEHISAHPRVVPTIKNIKGIDVFFDGQPFDLKITPLPRNYDPDIAIQEPSSLAVWMYENQGAQRFGNDNRLFVVLLDKDSPEKSWELKRNFELIFQRIDDFFSKEKVSNKDEIGFSFSGRTYTAISKVLIITKEIAATT